MTEGFYFHEEKRNKDIEAEVGSSGGLWLQVSDYSSVNHTDRAGLVMPREEALKLLDWMTKVLRPEGTVTDPAEELLNGLVGLVQMLCMRTDVSEDMRRAVAINHRYVDAVAFIERHGERVPQPQAGKS